MPQARGDVYVAQSSDKFPVGGLIWQSVELPALKEGMKSGRITAINDPVLILVK